MTLDQFETFDLVQYIKLLQIATSYHVYIHLYLKHGITFYLNSQMKNNSGREKLFMEVILNTYLIMVFLLFGNIYFLVFADKDIICYVALSNQLLVYLYM